MAQAAAEAALFLEMVTLGSVTEPAELTAGAGEQQAAQVEVINQAAQAVLLYQALLLHLQIVGPFTVAHNDLQRFL